MVTHSATEPLNHASIDEALDPRTALSIAWMSINLAVLATGLIVILRLLLPAPTQTYGMSEPVELGRVDAVTLHREGPRLLANDRVWLVYTEFGWLALENRSPHRGCRMKWQKATNAFVDPCHGSIHGAEGRYHIGPSGRDMRRLPLAAVDADGQVIAHSEDGGTLEALPKDLVLWLVADLAD